MNGRSVSWAIKVPVNELRLERVSVTQFADSDVWKSDYARAKVISEWEEVIKNEKMNE